MTGEVDRATGHCVETVAAMLAAIANVAASHHLVITSDLEADGLVCYQVRAGEGGEVLAVVGWDDLDERFAVTPPRVKPLPTWLPPRKRRV